MRIANLKEWIGSNDNQAIPPRVKVRIFQKADGKCQGDCGLKIVGKLRPAYDHIQALCNGGEHRESNLQLLCVPCHSIKTKTDVAEKSAVARKQKKHIGAFGPKRKLQSRGFAKTKPQHTATRQIERHNYGDSK
jgi:5-methylcytosine-specific restriction protein A